MVFVLVAICEGETSSLESNKRKKKQINFVIIDHNKEIRKYLVK